MFFRKKSEQKVATTPTGRGSELGKNDSKKSEPKASEKITVREVTSPAKPVRRQYPGPPGAEALLRIAVDRRAYAELIAHAKESLEVEVCGVLVGQVCEDDAGLFVHVEAVLRGSAASQGSTHVTFTQATWTAIHATLERDHPKLQIVGWYHTHPGFGVEFSDMDLFIQRNFFSGPAQIALVTDPLSGAVAICANTDKGSEYVSRFWVDGREQPCQVPTKEPSPGGGAAESAGAAAKSLQALEARVSQLVQVVDEQRASFHRFLLFCGMVFCLGIIGVIGYWIYSNWAKRLEPPRLNSYVRMPVQIGNRTVLLGVGVVDWDVPDELNAILLQMEQLRREAAEKAASEAAEKAGQPASEAPPAEGLVNKAAVTNVVSPATNLAPAQPAQPGRKP